MAPSDGNISDTLSKALLLLAKERPVFHSEADFKFSLAICLQTCLSDAKIRLEKPVQVGSKYDQYLDIYFVHGQGKFGIELKYYKKGFSFVDPSEEEFVLKNGGALDVPSFGFWKDVSRLENMIKEGKIDEGVVPQFELD